VDAGKKLLPKENEEVFDLNGKIVLPGLVNAHTHLYSTLSRGMPQPKTAPKNFLEILKKVWWRLDRALDDETIYYSALIGGIEAVKNGTTTFIDHHASPNAISGSLNIIKEALQKVGMRGVLCYEVTDRGGRKKRDDGLYENDQFIRENKQNPFFRGLVGAHASFTLNNQSLELCGDLANAHNVGVHIHVAEDGCDVDDAKKKYKKNIIERLAEKNILRNQTILAHCIHLSEKEFSFLKKTDVVFAHNPRSNMNNKVGYSPIHQFNNRGMIGTDGFPSDMFEESKIAFFKRQDSQFPQTIDFAQLISGGQQYISSLFGKKFGSFEKNSVADLVIMDYIPPTSMTTENILGHYLFGMRSSNVESVMIGGKWVVKNRTVLGVDVERAYHESEKKSKKMWIKMMETVP
jgi:putative selenium metabolism protein SsnA